jgi:trehalose 6-phosphate phosphatase
VTTARPLPDLRPLRAALPSALVALDFDGTLAPISPHPDDARVAAGVAALLRDLRAAGAAVAVVTGRSVASLLRVSGFGAVPGIVIYGLHGLERWEDGRLVAPPVPPGIHELRLSLPAIVDTADDPDVWIEDKELSLVVHARLAAEPGRLVELLRAPVTKAAAAAGLEVHPGKGVLEICIPGTDKGTAVRELIGDQTAAVCYAGDDVGDVPAVQAVNDWSGRTGRPALTVAVSPSGPGPLAGLADVTVADPPGLVALLRQVIAAEV